MIFSAMPCYGPVTAEASKSFYCSASTKPYRTSVVGGSLLTANFNMAWAEALNLRDELGLTHFSMIHGDVFARTGYIDTLIDVMNDTGADVVSAIIPIKDSRGLTSTAIDTDPWSPRRLSMAEIMVMPETFGNLQQGNLLINTGCWVCRFDAPWVEKICFTINDRLIKRDGKWVAQVQPEDWNFSRQLHALGLKVVATRRVQIRHIGPAGYENGHAWGAWKTDENRIR